MVKRLRHHPFTVVSRVRIPVGSPISPSGSKWTATPAYGGGAPFRREIPQDVVRGLIKFVLFYGSIAQLGEHLPYKQGVTGSSPVTSTKISWISVSMYLAW